MTPAALLYLPFALDGEAAGGNSTALGVASVVSVVIGWIVLAALWYFVFRPRAREKRHKRSPD